MRALQPDDAADGALPPTPTVPTAAELSDKPGVQAHVSTFKSFCEVFSKPPQERAVAGLRPRAEGRSRWRGADGRRQS